MAVPSNNRWGGTVNSQCVRAAREDSVRPRRLMGASGRPLNFTVKPHNQRHART
jgi:hypothetical protein